MRGTSSRRARCCSQGRNCHGPRSSWSTSRRFKRFAQFASKISGVPLLRIYWYDGTSTGPTAQHLTLAHLSDIKLRLGFVNSVGEQKGVDSLIVTDMIALARNRAISDAVLVSGDEDLRVGVQQAQEFGVRVHLIGIKPSRGSQSLFLLQEADTTHEWSIEEVSKFLACKPKPASSLTPAAATILALPTETAPVEVDPLGSIAVKIAETLEKTEIGALVEAFDSTHQLPRDVDRQLLAGGRSAMFRDLGPAEKKQIRLRFIEVCRLRLTE
jgi:NYN domain-containing protein